MLALLALLQVAAPPDTTLPRVTLNEALERAARLDPDYVRAAGQVATAEWSRRAALAVFVVPAVTLNLDVTRYSDAFFNIGTGTLQATSVTFRADARYELFSIRKFADLARTRAELDGAQAGDLQARFASALLTESDYYSVLENRELARVADERFRRAREAFQVARARVLSGGAVQTDSLELALELTRARVDQLRQAAGLRVARLELGRRIGIPGPVDAAALDSLVPPELPITVEEAVERALSQGPDYRRALAGERAAAASLRSRRGEYLPTLTLTGSHNRFDTQVFPSARTVSSIALGVSLPIWNNAQREIGIAQARVNRDVARAIRSDLERAARVDVTQAYELYVTSRASEQLQREALLVARENYRVQDARYRAGAATILDLLGAQVGLTEAESQLVQARFARRLALAGLEGIIGERLFRDRVLP